jgi:hypothetical protein
MIGRRATALVGALALAACERRAPPAPVDETPRPVSAPSPAAGAAGAAAPPPTASEPSAPRPEDLRVVLGTEASLAAPPGPPATNVARRPWAGPIDQMLAEDGPDPVFLSKTRVASPGADLDALFARGLANLRKACPQPIAGDRTVEGRSHVWISRFADNYTSARLLLPELWTKIAAANHGHLYAAAPARDILLWTTSTAKDDQLGFRAQARTAFQSRSFPISPAILRWTGRGWKLEDPNPVP